MSFWEQSSVLVTGGAGFLGTWVVEKLRQRGCQRVFVPRSAQYDLRHVQDIRRVLEASAPDIVIHLAAKVGGIGANRMSPAEFFYDNLMMGVQLLHESWRANVRKLVAIGTVCAYPKFTPVPFLEADFWSGYPEETNAPYGLAKKMLLVQAQAYRQQHGFNAIYLIPANLYGPGDSFDLEKSHVIPALIRKCVEVKERGERQVPVWGSGTPTREFLYAEDAAEGILLATERYSGEDPVNLGSGEEISIRDLATLIGRLVGLDLEIVWDPSRPNGQPRRRLDISRAERLIGFRARVALEEGLRRTIEWYNQTHLAAGITQR